MTFPQGLAKLTGRRERGADLQAGGGRSVNLPNLSFLLVVACFWLAFWVVNRQLVRPILALLDERENRVASGRKAFEEARAAMEEALAARERELAQAAAEAQKERALLRAEGERQRREKLEEAREQGQRRLAAFQVELERETENARQQLKEHTLPLARELAQRLLGRALPS